MASILFCGGHLQAAVRVLEDVERRYDSKVMALCGCRRKEGGRNLEVFPNMQSGNKDNGFSELRFACCVRFHTK
ncbi:hypothetical protein DPMN_171636 [Dreissena polymorpha]|uniref:Uncharacterized protein n=1 Tax=Dreissena polymorpha TaxID=45954 RepID=A0A9D4E0Q3_DREPO|nr:hypothetical protein DPMN_171636 [Dreissena polymorpha]